MSLIQNAEYEGWYEEMRRPNERKIVLGEPLTLFQMANLRLFEIERVC